MIQYFFNYFLIINKLSNSHINGTCTKSDTEF